MPRLPSLPAAAQTSKGVVFGTYMIKVDTIAAARTTRAEMTQLWNSVQNKFVADDQVRGGQACGGDGARVSGMLKLRCYYLNV